MISRRTVVVTRLDTARRYAMPSVAGLVMIAGGHVLLAQRPVASRDESVNEQAAMDAMLARRVTVDLVHVPRKRAIDALSQSSKVLVQYQISALDAYPDFVTLQVTNTTLGAALERVLKGTSLRVAPDGTEHLVLVDTDSVASRDSTRLLGQITGVILDSATGKPLARASVSVKESKLTPVTGEDGHFRLANVPEGERAVVVKLLGYRSMTRPVDVRNGATTSLRFAMAPMANILSGVVTTATGIQKRLEVGNDITTINADSVMRTAPVTSVTDLLETRVPGLQVLRTSGVPGAPSRLRLRGTNSINGNNDPILIVDGVRIFAAQSDSQFGSTSLAKRKPSASVTPAFGTRSPLDQIDPNTIATIEVFKGPSATAQWGSDAANGVIVITTKRGKAGRTRVNGTVSQGVQYIPGKYPDVFFPFYHNVYGYGSYAEICARYDTNCTLDSTATFQALNLPYLTILGRGSSSRATGTVSGGTDAVTYSVTGTGATTTGLVKLPDIEKDRYRKFYGAEAPGWMRHPDHLDEWSINSNLGIRVTPTTSLQLSSQINNGDQRGSSLEGAIAQLANTYVDRTLLDSVPLIKQFYERLSSGRLHVTTSAQALARPWAWLPLTGSAGIDVTDATDKDWIPRGPAQANTADSAGYFSIGRGNILVKSFTAGTDQVPLTRFAVLSGGVNYTGQSNATIQSTATSLPPGVEEPRSFPCVSGGSLCSASTQASVSTSTYGWFLEPRLNVNSRFFVTPGFRLDGGSASGALAGLTAFPKLNMSWVAVDREGRAPLLGVLSFVRPRLSLGVAGVQPGPSQRLRLLHDTVVTTDAGVTQEHGLSIASLGNVGLHPERTREVEGGGEISLWGTRLQLDLTISRKVTHDAIVNIPVAVSVYGGGNISTNIGIVHNNSLELSSNIELLQTSAVGWHAGASLSTNRNRLVQLAPGVAPITISSDGFDTRLVPGFPLFGRWVRPILGFSDADRDGLIQPREVLVGDTTVFVGQEEPNYHVTANTDVSLFQRFTFNATLDYTNGLTQVNAVGQGIQRALNDPASPLEEQASAVVLPSGYGPRDCPNNACPYQTLYGVIQTVSTLRLNSISLRYELPSSFARRLRTSTMSVALQGSNLGLWTNYRGKDPNVNANVTGNGTSDFGQLPQPRSWVLQCAFTL